MAPSDTPVNRGNPVSFKPAILVIGWLLFSAFAFWWYDYRYWQSYPDHLVQFESKAIEKLYPILNTSNSEKTLVVHFADDDCPCEAYRVAHVEDIQPVLSQSQQVTIKRSDAETLGLNLAASPSVAIWNEAGELAYFGPYSSGMTCGTGFDFVSMVFSKLNDKVNPQWINTQGFGCFCSWQED